MKIKVKIISSFDELGPFEKSFAKIRGEYFIWNIKSRYSYNPDFIQKNMRRSNSILDNSLAPYYKMKKSGIFPEDRLEKLKSDFENGQKFISFLVIRI